MTDGSDEARPEELDGPAEGAGDARFAGLAFRQCHPDHAGIAETVRASAAFPSRVTPPGARFGVPVPPLAPRMMLTIAVRLRRVLDQTDPDVRAAWGLTRGYTRAAPPNMHPGALVGHRPAGHLCRTAAPPHRRTAGPTRHLAPPRMPVPHRPTASDRIRTSVARLTAGVLLAALGAAGCGGEGASQPVIGLITKTETNPFFVKMREGAAAAAEARGARLLSGAGKNDGDNAGQVTALENMIAAGARVVLITVNDAKAIVPAIRRAREQGVLVIALDSPTDQVSAVDALYATDNYRAGTLIGRYARAALGGRAPRIATLDLLPGHPVGAQRHNGFLSGMGLAAPGAESTTLARPAEVACMVDTYGDQARGQTAMENCLQRDPGINVVYAINEPSAAGAHKALAAAGRERDVIVVSVDGGCQGVRDVQAGRLWATAQQYPVKMAELGVAAGVEFIRTGKKPSGYTDTGVALIAARPMPGVESQGVEAGLQQCFGDR